MYHTDPPRPVPSTAHRIRRGLGIKYKDSTPPDLRDYIYKFNEFRYKDILGPTYQYLRECKGLSDAQIIVGAAKNLGDKKKLGKDLFELFGDEIAPILKKYDMLD